MCRLFALHAGERDVAADFWLLNAPDSMSRQSEVNADGYGLAALTSKRGLIIIRNPVEAATNPAYQAVAQRLVAAEMLVHLRYADTGGTSLVNTHPFTQDGRAFAHNGVVGDLDRIEDRLGSNRAMVMGETDSERFFALITLSIREPAATFAPGSPGRSRRSSSATSSTASTSYSANSAISGPFATPTPTPSTCFVVSRGAAAEMVISTTQTRPERFAFIRTTPRRRRWS